MLFTDTIFLFYFLPFALILMRATTSVGMGFNTLSRLSIFLLTLVFYGYQHPWWLIPFFICIAFDFLWASLLTHTTSQRTRKLWLTLSIVQNLGLLCLFKYREFLFENLRVAFPGIAPFLPSISEGGLALALPAGISFYTFESMSFVIDVYWRKVQAPKKALEFFAFIGMFPRFVAGPIVRYKDMVGQFQSYRGMQIEAGLFLFIIGFCLKVLFADNFAIFTKYAFDRGGGQVEFFSAWIGSIAYMMQIYFDFSGYSLMAIGLGRCLGFQFPTNFNKPYLSQSLTEFWRRWHITLSTWLRDYLYIPLGGSRNGKWKTYRNLFLTMLLGGFWHGSSWNFLIWGAWHGGALSFEKATGFKPRKSLGRIYTLFLVLVGWVFFRARDLPEAVRVLKGMFSPIHQDFSFAWEGLAIHPISVAFCLLGFVFCFFVEPLFDQEKLEKIESVVGWQRATAVATMGVAVLFSFSFGQIPFLYFQF